MKPSTNCVQAAWPPNGTMLRLAILTLIATGLAGCQARLKDPNQVASAKISPEEFESKFKEIQLDMSGQQVDQILAGYPCERRELAEHEKEKPPNPYGFDWELKRKASFVKSYNCKPHANEGSLYMEVYFDDNGSVVGHLLGNEFQRKCSEIQHDMTEEQVDQILAGYPCKERRDVFDFEKERALWPGGKHTRTASFVKTYDCKADANEGDFYIMVYFDDNYLVVGKVFGEYIS